MTEDRVALLRAPAARAAARVALNLLDAAHAAEQRVRERTDNEALHDFRVSIRRLDDPMYAEPVSRAIQSSCG